MADKKSFVLYYDLCKIFSELTDEQAGQLIKEITNYAEAKTHKNPQKPDGLSGLLNAIAVPFKNHIDRDFELWEQKREINIKNGKNGGRPKKAKNHKNPEKGVTVTATVNVTDTVNDNNSVQNSGTERKISIIDFIKECHSNEDAADIEQNTILWIPTDCELIWKGYPDNRFMPVWKDFVEWHIENKTQKTELFWRQSWAEYSSKNRSIENGKKTNNSTY